MSRALDRIQRRIAAAAAAPGAAPELSGPVVEAQPPAAPPAPTEAPPEAPRKRGRPVTKGKRKAAGPKDRHGRAFDPAIHLADDSGSPILDSKNACRIKPRREALEERAAHAEADQAKEAADQPQAEAAPAAEGLPAGQLAALAVSLYAGTLEGLTGRPIADASRSALNQAAARYLEHSPITVTPGAALAFTAGAVTLGAVVAAEAGTPAAALRDRFLPASIVAMFGGSPSPSMSKPQKQAEPSHTGDTAPASAPDSVTEADGKAPGKWY
jgi:hypothetical protein